ncbi:MAG TPA: group II intron reverse transcriptase/maturase [Bryobacteraceae bacterium]|nr:group II intron reverse transcriptase/maturase [Bryobacteraceae bacterium]
MSTTLKRIAELARKLSGKALLSLAHHIDVDFLREAYARTRKNGATGIDGVTAREYERELEKNLRRLLDQFKSGTYKAPPVRRAYIPKADGGQRPLGVPTFEDKVLQRAVTMVLETVYEQDFLPSSYGYRPGTGALYALRDLRQELMAMGGGWVLEADIRSFYDRMVHQHLRSFLDRRVRDGVIRRAIDKWLKAGVMEEGRIHFPEDGSPQGGVISPLLANIYLHEVLDVWFESVVKPRMRGRARLIRYADDFVICFQREDDARRVAEVLPKRLARYGLTLHPDKTRLFRYRAPDEGGHGQPPTFDFLGFTHYWARSRSGRWVIKRKTIAKRLARKAHEIWAWCRQNRHEPLEWQRKRLASRLLGYYNYFGITGNAGALDALFRSVQRAWHYWLSRRTQRGTIRWKDFAQIAERFPLPRPRIVHHWV